MMDLSQPEWKFECARCGRIWHGSPQEDAIECICHMDCEYCGREQTVTTPVTRSGLTPKLNWTPQNHDPDPWNTTYGPCSNCGHYQARPVVYATPLSEEQTVDEYLDAEN